MGTNVVQISEEFCTRFVPYRYGITYMYGIVEKRLSFYTKKPIKIKIYMPCEGM